MAGTDSLLLPSTAQHKVRNGFFKVNDFLGNRAAPASLNPSAPPRRTGLQRSLPGLAHRHLDARPRPFCGERRPAEGSLPQFAAVQTVQNCKFGSFPPPLCGQGVWWIPRGDSYELISDRFSTEQRKWLPPSPVIESLIFSFLFKT